MAGKQQQQHNGSAGNKHQSTPNMTLLSQAPATRNIGGKPTPMNKFVLGGMSKENFELRCKDFAENWGKLKQEDLSSADYYFDSYSHFGIHEEMLKDSVRTGAYQTAILENKHLFKDKIVLDVGSGTGILSLFAAQAGAKHVYAIDGSEIIEISRKIIEMNGMSSKITLFKSKVEEVELPVTSVDIIISEWMGYFLLYESMLDTVLWARDKWLAPDGLMFPDRATLHVAGIEDREYREEKLGFWNSVYDLDFSCVRDCIIEDPIVDVVNDDVVCTDACCILDLDIKTCTLADLDFVSAFKLKMTRQDFVHAFIAWFDVQFSACHRPVTFSTGPHSRFTHWKQCVFYIEDVITGQMNEEIVGLIAVRKNARNPRDLDIKMEYTFDGKLMKAHRQQMFRLR